MFDWVLKTPFFAVFKSNKTNANNSLKWFKIPCVTPYEFMLNLAH